MIVAISGWRKSGKDTAASFLIEDLKFERLAFADLLKVMVADQYNIDLKFLHKQDLKEKPLLHYPVNPQDEFSRMVTNFLDKEMAVVDGVKYWTPRAMAILEGSVKRSVDPQYWVSKAVFTAKPSGFYVISDLRYKSEANQLKAFGEKHGHKVFLLRVNRFDTCESTDPSERDLDDFDGFDLVIENRSSLDDFKNSVLGAVAHTLL